jgi:hypothetical protein
VPFIRYTRDKRGYETTYVVHGQRAGQGSGRTRVLYLFRSPANVTIGRKPLDDEARVALEHTHPDLSFDWQSLSREVVAPRPDPAPRPWKGAKPAPPPPSAPAPVAPPPAPDDHSLLGRVLGVKEAARLRGRYSELLQRVARRARSPEERDRLTERARRLNPDDWGDESAVRAGVSTVEAEWDAVATALPQRRRGRRGGRRREPGANAPGPSGIMAMDGDVDDREQDAQVDRLDRDSGDSGDDDSVG